MIINILCRRTVCTRPPCLGIMHYSNYFDSGRLDVPRGPQPYSLRRRLYFYKAPLSSQYRYRHIIIHYVS
jgi:hypothetical protein